jgi:signal transduction histidine kinase
MLERIESGVQANRQLVADASHELRTPLAAMRAELDVSLRDRSRTPAEREVLESVRDDVDRMSRTVSDLLMLARADEGKLELVEGVVELDKEVADAARPLRALARAKGVSLFLDGEVTRAGGALGLAADSGSRAAVGADRDSGETVPDQDSGEALDQDSGQTVLDRDSGEALDQDSGQTVLDRDSGEALADGDPQQIRQAITNLIENAIDFTPSGGRVTVTTWRRGDEVGVTVADTGVGIPAEALPKVFDRFYRADPSRSRESGGSGLGLAICREIVTAHGGRIWVQSEEGNGSEFSFALPVNGRE